MNDDFNGSTPPPGRRRAFRWASVIVTVLFVLVLTVFYEGVDLFGISQATSTHSAKIAARVAAPMYGYADGAEGDDDAAAHIAPSTRNITVVLIDSASLKQLNSSWPLSYQDQGRIFRRILSYKPRALFVNFAYAYDRGNLTPFLERLAKDGARFTTAAKTGVSETGVLLPVIGEAVAWSEEEVVDELLSPESPFEHGVVGFKDLSGYYPYADQIERPSGEKVKVPSAAFQLFELACAVDANAETPRRIGYSGCEDLETLREKDEGELWVEWGALHPELWQFAGDYVEATPEKLHQATQDSATCRYFAPDFTSRVKETWAQIGNVFWGEGDAEVERICPYHVTIPAYDVFATNARMPDYLRWAIEDKIVLIGAAIPGASPRVDIIDTQGPAVYLHAMALDNLLHQGADHLARGRPLSDAFEEKSVVGGLLQWLGLGDRRLEIAPELMTVLAILGAHLLLRGPLARMTLKGWNPLVEFLLPFVSWMLISWVIAAVTAAISFSYFALSPHDWVGTFLLGGTASKLLDAVHPSNP
ncbi:MAG: CHASE2 domain-containing protein [Rhodobacteraceae bacterium]|nr:CHASE2 domain-containing protein [Paracoccaceae bacterium]